jgi:uncharacterized protein YjbJ (UPF0337 family)
MAFNVPREYVTGAHMKPSTTDQVTGKFHELKGVVKEKVGQVVNDPNLETEGQAEKLTGKVQHKIGQIEKVFEK